MAENPYTSQEVYPPDAGPYPATDSAYTVEAEGYPWNGPADLWSPGLNRDGGPDGTPDGMRSGSDPVRYMRPDPTKPPQEFYQPWESEHDQREESMQEKQDSDGWERLTSNQKLMGGRVGGKDRPPEGYRPTQKLSPGNFQFFRLFDQGQKGLGPRRFNGLHFSMADHRRNYEINNEYATKSRRNTYRLDPPAWDTDIVDRPGPAEFPSAVYEEPALSGGSGNRSWRL